MSTFTFERGLNKKGLELIEAYKVFLDNNTSSFVKEAIKKSIQNEKTLKVRHAVKDGVSVEEFVEIVSSYEEYMSGIEEIQEAAIVFVTNNIPTNSKVDIIKGNKTYLTSPSCGRRAHRIYLDGRLNIKEYQDWIDTCIKPMLFPNGEGIFFI